VSLCAAAAAKDFASTAHRIHEDFSESLAGFGCHRVRAALLRLLIPQLPGTDIHSWAFFLFFVLVVISSLFLPSSSSSSLLFLLCLAMIIVRLRSRFAVFFLWPFRGFLFHVFFWS
jgi:hypothetical protein